MSVLLTIGEFSRMTHLSVKALRHYDDVGLLSPAQVDGSSGYRLYATGQVPTAQVIRRFRDLDMPLEEIRTVLNAADVAARDQAIVAHLAAHGGNARTYPGDRRVAAGICSTGTGRLCPSSTGPFRPSARLPSAPSSSGTTRSSG